MELNWIGVSGSIGGVVNGATLSGLSEWWLDFLLPRSDSVQCLSMRCMMLAASTLSLGRNKTALSSSSKSRMRSSFEWPFIKVIVDFVDALADLGLLFLTAGFYGANRWELRRVDFLNPS